MRDLAEEVKLFEKYFFNLQRHKGETMTKYAQEEETSYRKVQNMLQRVVESNTDKTEKEYSDDDEDTKTGKTIFELPKRRAFS